MLRNLVVPPQLEFVGDEIVKSSGRPDTANRVDNVTKGRTGIIVWDYLTNPKYWFMMAEKGEHKLKHYSREKFRTRSYMDDDTESNYISARESYAYGYSDYKGLFGTNPL